MRFSTWASGPPMNCSYSRITRRSFTLPLSAGNSIAPFHIVNPAEIRANHLRFERDCHEVAVQPLAGPDIHIRNFEFHAGQLKSEPRDHYLERVRRSVSDCRRAIRRELREIGEHNARKMRVGN